MNIQQKIFLSIAFLLCFSAQAQFSSFEAEGQVFYQVKGVVPYTSLEFYSHTGGGKLLQTQEADEAGKLTLVSDKDFKPAFVLNRKTQEAGKLSGNGKVYFLEEKAFTLQEPAISVQESDDVQISWKAAVAPDKNISFHLLKTMDGNSFSEIGRVSGFSSEEVISYMITDYQNPGLYYILEVKDVKEGKQYSTKRLVPSGGKIRLFPTIASGQITVLNAGKELELPYRIINNLGQQIKSGFLKRGANEINIRSLAPGDYFLETLAGKEKDALRFIRR